MKNSLLIAFLFVGVSSQAQNFMYEPNQNVEGSLESGVYLDYNINISSTSPEAITYKWVTIKNTLLFGWDYSLCDYGHCVEGIPSSGEMNSITEIEASEGVKGFFKLTIDGGDITGKGEVQIYVYDSNDSTRGDTVSYTISNGQVAIKQVENEALTIYPNPSSNEVHIDNLNANSILEITDIQGKIVEQNSLIHNGVATFNVVDWQNGIYLVKVIEDGVAKMSKLVVRH